MKTVKLNLFMFAIAASAVLYTACDPHHKNIDELSVTKNALEFSAEGGVENVDVVTNVKSWESNSSSNWMKIARSGVDFSVVVEKYTDTSKDRVGEITVKAGDAKPVTVTVTQKASVPVTLTVDPKSLSFGADDTGVKPAAVTTNATNWDFNCNANWLTVTKQGNKLNVKPNSANTGSSQRTASITVTAGNADPVTVQVIQAGKSLYPPTGTYSATRNLRVGTQFASTWNGTTSLTSGHYSISNFGGDANWKIFVDFKDGKAYLDEYSNLAEVTLTGVSGTFIARLICLIKYNTTIGIINYNPNYPTEVKYNSATRVLDFSQTVNINFGGSIGMVNDLPLYVGIGFFPKSGSGNTYIWDAATDIKLTITASSSAPVSSQSINDQMPDSQNMFQKKTVSNQVLTIDASKLKPVEMVSTEIVR